HRCRLFRLRTCDRTRTIRGPYGCTGRTSTHIPRFRGRAKRSAARHTLTRALRSGLAARTLNFLTLLDYTALRSVRGIITPTNTHHRTARPRRRHTRRRNHLARRNNRVCRRATIVTPGRRGDRESAG